MSRTAIRVENLSKQYVLGGEIDQSRTFREMLTDAFRQPFSRLRRLQGKRDDKERFWALKDVSFEVEEGEVVGIIGANGAGKSTLLKVLSRITAPTRGEVVYRGRVASLLEVGTGFHPELSGRENIYVNGAILGMKKHEITARFDEIVEFAGVEQFLDTPVKRYSSGMYVRLAFAVAAHLDPDILIVDEVLAVGDAKFQKKCIGKMQDVSRQGRTVLFVSHNMGMISKLCARGLMLQDGQLMFDGMAGDAIQAYFKHNITREDISEEEHFGDMMGLLVFKNVTINSNEARMGLTVEPDHGVVIEVTGEAKQDLESYRTTISLRKDGDLIVSIHDARAYHTLEKGGFKATAELPPFLLAPGNYSVEVGGYTSEGRWVWVKNIASFSITNHWFEQYDTNANMGLINLPEAGAYRLLNS